jgi:uncharacterized membrane protein
MKKNISSILAALALLFSLESSFPLMVSAGSELIEIPFPVEFVSGDGFVAAGSSMIKRIDPIWPNSSTNLTYRWTENEGAVIIHEKVCEGLDTSAINLTGINFDGSVIVGYIHGEDSGEERYRSYSLRWTELTGFLYCFVGPTGPPSSMVYDISGDGSVMTGVYGSVYEYNAFIWRETSGLDVLEKPSLCSGFIDTIVSGDGQTIVGNCDGHFIRWRESTGFEDLGTGRAVDLSTDGDVIVGEVGGQAFKYTDLNGIQQIGSFSPVAADAECLTIVGSSVVWEEGVGVQPIEDYLLSRGIDIVAEGWSSITVTDISNDGRVIAGSGFSEMIIIDNMDDDLMTTEPDPWDWSNIDPGGYDDFVQYAPPGDGNNWAIWSVPELTVIGAYPVYAQWSEADNHAPDATYTIFSGYYGSEDVVVDQRIDGGQFNYLGDLHFGIMYPSPEYYYIKLSDSLSGYVIADAVKILSRKGWIAKLGLSPEDSDNDCDVDGADLYSNFLADGENPDPNRVQDFAEVYGKAVCP